jgi:hypothetical protein
VEQVPLPRKRFHRSPLAAWAVACAAAACGDDGDAPAVDGGGPDAPSGGDRNRVFITRATFSGGLLGSNGTAGADAACDNAAGGLGGVFVAWVSTSSVDAITRIPDEGPWYDLDGMMIFENRAGLEGDPLAPLWLDETGNYLPSDFIWTGTELGGTFSDQGACNDWTSSFINQIARVGQVGRADAGAWTAASSTTCDQMAHVICFEY